MKKRLEIDTETASELAGAQDAILRALEKRLGCEIYLRGNILTLEGDKADVSAASAVISEISKLIESGLELTAETVDVVVGAAGGVDDVSGALGDLVWQHRNIRVTPRSMNQSRYVSSIRNNTITFAIGPAGTGKTYLAVALAVSALSKGDVNRIILTRPAVEAGERLGFLPGDLMEKVDPYLRPLFDALYDMLDPEKVSADLERGVIEVAPLAFMRGRTLNDSFIILDEAQNTSPEQMKMFLTRLGFNSKMVVTGDITQIDLPSDQSSGLVEVNSMLRGLEDIEFIHFSGDDVVRHKLIQRIVEAYKEYDERQGAKLEATGSRAKGRMPGGPLGA